MHEVCHRNILEYYAQKVVRKILGKLKLCMHKSVKSYSLILRTVNYSTADTGYYRFSRCILCANIL